tara:strand:- start:8605 stop:8796 length:192 start_codon:yes stop_codon:yes gene_type:complete
MRKTKITQGQQIKRLEMAVGQLFILMNRIVKKLEPDEFEKSKEENENQLNIIDEISKKELKNK